MRESDAMLKQEGREVAAPAVSVIVPVYNASEYLDECLESVARQGFRDFEVLMVDDGSTDSSSEICKRFARADGRFRYLHRTNGGLAAARNTGLDAARGRWVLFLDADDTIHPRTLADLTLVAEEKGTEITAGEFYIDIVDRRGTLPRHARVDLFSSDDILERALYQEEDLTSVCGILYSRNLFERGERFTEGTWYEDLDIFYRLFMLVKEVAVVRLPYYFYRQHPKSFIHTFSPHRLCVLDVVDRLEKTIAAQRPSLLPAARDRRFAAHYNILLLLLAHGCPDPSLIRRCHSAIKAQRWRTLANPRVRLKNKLGAALSLGGLPLIRLFARKPH